MILNEDIVEGLGYHFRFRLIFKPISILVQLTRDNLVHPVSKGLNGQFDFRCADTKSFLSHEGLKRTVKWTSSERSWSMTHGP